MKPQVLITRENRFCSEFKVLLKGCNCRVICQSFIETQSAKPNHIPHGEWVFFSSPRAVKHYFNLAAPGKNQKFAALSSGTANELKKHTPCTFEGRKSSGESVKAFAAMLKPGEKVVIPRSNISVRRLQQVLQNNQYREFVLYNTLPLNIKLAQTPEIVVFTSPGNVKAYCTSDNKLPKKVVAIGKTTAGELVNYGAKPLISEGYTPEELALAVRQLL